MKQFAIFRTFGDLVDIMCLWHDAEFRPFPREIYCGQDPAMECAVCLPDFGCKSETAVKNLTTLANECHFAIRLVGALPERFAATPLEELPGWSGAFRDPFTASPGGGAQDTPSRRYILGAKDAESSQKIWHALRSCRASGLGVRPVPEAESFSKKSSDGLFKYFWLVTEPGLPVAAPEKSLPPPLGVLGLAEHVWWELPASPPDNGPMLFFEWPFEPALSPDALRALMRVGSDAILLSRHLLAPSSAGGICRHPRFPRADRGFPTRESRRDISSTPRVEPKEIKATFDIDLRLVRQTGQRALNQRDRDLEIAINSLLLRRSRRRALDIRMGRVAQFATGPFVVDSIDELDPELREPFLRWAKSPKRQGRYLYRSFFIEPLMVYIEEPEKTPAAICELLTDMAGQDEDLRALRYLCLPDSPVPEYWNRGHGMPVNIHLLTTGFAVDRKPLSNAHADHRRVLGLRLLDYGANAHARFELSFEWAEDNYNLRLFIPYDKHLEFYPHIVPSETAAKKIAAAILPGSQNGGDPRDEWCAIVLPGTSEDCGIRCIQLQRSAFRPLDEAFSWDLHSSAVPVPPELPKQLEIGADALAKVVADNFNSRAEDAIKGEVAARIRQVDAASDKLQAETVRFRKLEEDALKTDATSKQLDASARRLRRGLNRLSKDVERLERAATVAGVEVKIISKLAANLTQLKQDIDDLSK